MEARVHRLTVLGWMAGMALSWPLWFPVFGTAFPIIPYLPAFGQLPILQTICSLGIILSGAFLLLYPARKGPFFMLLSLLGGSMLLNLNAAQAWVWFYFILLSAMLIRLYGKTDKPWSGVQAVLVTVYFWGGLNKITPYFAEDNFAWFCGASSWMEPLGKMPWLAYTIAVAEAFFALGLLWRRSRRFTRIAVLLFHLFICLALSPMGLNWNLVVLPWNFTLAAIIWVLFNDQKPFVLPRQLAMLGLLAVVWIGPALNILGLFPDAFSWKLYSNTQAEATFYNAALGTPCPELGPVWRQNSFQNQEYLLLDDWSNTRLGVPMHASKRVFFAVGKHLCQCANTSDSSGLYILTVDPWNQAAEKMDFYPCAWLRRQ